MRHSIVGIIFVAALAMSACSNKDEHTASGSGTSQTAATSKPATATVDAATARAEFKSRCASCHGEQGKGNGPAAGALNPKPRDYTNVAWQKSVTDEDIKKTILYGGAAVGKSPIMPAQPDLDSKPELLNALVAVVRDFNGK